MGNFHHLKLLRVAIPVSNIRNAFFIVLDDGVQGLKLVPRGEILVLEVSKNNSVGIEIWKVGRWTGKYWSRWLKLKNRFKLV